MPKKIMNDAHDVLHDSMEGFLLLHPELKKTKEGYGIYREDTSQRVKLISGGGSGHDPMQTGLIKPGMLDGVAVGNVFTSPDPITILNTISAVHGEAGVLCVIWNYAGDVMNFEMALQMAKAQGMKVGLVKITDDIASAIKRTERRGVAGLLLAVQLIGAQARQGMSLQDCIAFGESVNEALNTIGVAFTPCSLFGEPYHFQINEDCFEYGMGIHGEPGQRIESMCSAKEMVTMMMDDLMKEGQYHQGDEVLVLINGMNATSGMELNIAFKEVMAYLNRYEVTVYHSLVEHRCTSLEMSGFSITLLNMKEEWKSLYDVYKYQNSMGGDEYDQCK